MQEEWRDVVDYEGVYLISNFGNIKRLQKQYVDTFHSGRRRVLPERIVKPWVMKNGYLAFTAHNKNKRKTLYVHREVCKAFIPNPDNLPFINHKDENKLNNNADNLEWCTILYNNTYNGNRKRMVATRKAKGNYKCTESQKKKISKALKLHYAERCKQDGN